MIDWPLWSLIVHAAISVLLAGLNVYVLYRWNRSRRALIISMNWLTSVIPDDVFPTGLNGSPPIPGKERYGKPRVSLGEEWERELEEDPELSRTHPVVEVSDEFLLDLEAVQRGEQGRMTKDEMRQMRSKLAREDLAGAMSPAEHEEP